MIVFDHQKLVRRDPHEVKRFRTLLLSNQAGKVTEVSITHQHDDSCCKQEPWEVTAAQIAQAVSPSTKQVMVNIENPPRQT